MTSRPGLFTGKYLMYYACIAYFSSFGFSIVLYFQNVDNFTSVSSYIGFKKALILMMMDQFKFMVDSFSLHNYEVLTIYGSFDSYLFFISIYIIAYGERQLSQLS